MKHSGYESVVKSFQALSIGVGGLFIVVAEAAAGAPVPKPNKLTNEPIVRQIGAAFDSETGRWDDLAACFHKPNRIGRSEVRNLLRE